MSPEIRAAFVAAAICFVCWRLYQRVRASIGRQPLRKTWLIARALALASVCALVLLFTPADMSQTALYAGCGAMIGALIAAHALRHTRIEQTGQGIFYTGHPYIGLGILALFVGRLLFMFAMTFSRRAEIVAQVKAHGGSVGDVLARSEGGPVTVALLVLMSGYYITYSLGLLRRA